MAEPSYKKSKGSNADFMACTDKKIKASKLKNKLVDITGEIVAINYSTQSNNLAPYPIVKIDKIELVNIEHHHSGNPTESGGFGRSGGFSARGRFR